MTDWRSLRGSNFLSPEDLETGPALITIVEVKGEEMLDDNEKIKKEIAITFKGQHRNPQTGKIEDLLKTEWVANVINCELLEALFGTPHYEQWFGRKALVQQEPCEVAGKYLGKPSVRVAGGPELDRDLPVEIVLKMKGGKKRKPIHKVLHPTRNSGSDSAPANVDPVTGEVAADGNAETPTTATQRSLEGVATPNGSDEAQGGLLEDAAIDDGDVPGRGPLVKTTDPVTPARQNLLDNAWNKAINEGADEGELLAAVCDAVGAPTLQNLTMGQAQAALQYLQARS